MGAKQRLDGGPGALEDVLPGRGALRLQRWLALLLVGCAALAAVHGALERSGFGLLLLAVTLLLAAALCWRLATLTASGVHQSRAWSEVAAIKSILAQRETTWTTLPVPAAVWDAHGRLLAATPAWTELGIRTDQPPSNPEVSLGPLPRVFVVDSRTAKGGAVVVVLREVTRERQALNAKDELLAILGHELRTPLSSIKGYGQIMARQLATVQEQVLRLDQLIDDVLDTARADAGRLELRRAPVLVSDLLSAAAERFRAANQGRMLELRNDADALIEGDSIRLGQVLDNLLSNAAKYSPAATRIALTSTIDGDRVRIAVADQGRGIPAEYLPRLFERFYRVPSDGATGPQGFGLGLSIVRDLVEAHHGRVEVVSPGVDKGSTFTVVLPIAVAVGKQGPAEDPRAAADLLEAEHHVSDAQRIGTSQGV